tara:strand:+ start:2220 stop:2729 length:510 start_codon:yes stop_codon:yes gene_type:complete
MKHQKIGDIVPLGADIYMIEKIENGFVWMRQPNARGKSKKLYWREVPYFEEGKLVVPTMAEKPKTIKSNIHLGSFFKKNSGENIQVSREFIAFAYEWIDDLLYRILDDCIKNAMAKGHTRLMPSHFRRIHYENEHRYYNPDNDDYAIKESIWLDKDEESKQERGVEDDL